MGGVWEQQIRFARSILAAPLKQHEENLNDESLRTLPVEVEGIINSRPVTCDNIGDVNSFVPLNPMRLLSMKTKIVMPPPGIFQKEDIYCRNSCQEWNCPKRNFQVGDVVLVGDDSMRNKSPMAKVITT